MQYLLEKNSIAFIAKDLKHEILIAQENKLSDILTDHVQIVNKPTFIISGWKKTLMTEHSINGDDQEIKI